MALHMEMFRINGEVREGQEMAKMENKTRMEIEKMRMLRIILSAKPPGEKQRPKCDRHGCPWKRDGIGFCCLPCCMDDVWHSDGTE